MSQKQAMMLIATTTGIAFTGLVLVMVLMRPGLSSLVLLYASLFLTLFGSSTLFMCRLRKRFFHHEDELAQFGIALRQSILIAALGVSTLVLQSKRLVSWWNILLLFGILVLIEVFLSLRKGEDG